MAYQLFQLPKTNPLSSAGRVLPGSKISFFLTTTSTPTPVYTTSALNVAHTQPIEADAAGKFAPIYLDPTIVYKATVTDANDVLLYTVDPVNDQVLSQNIVAGYVWPKTSAETSAAATIANYAFQPCDVRRYGADPTGLADSTLAIQTAINMGGDVYFPGGTYLANNLTQTADFQKIKADGWVRIKKNASGPLFTSTGDDVELNGIGFHGDNTAGGFTGDNIVMNGENPRLINCGSRDTAGLPLKATGNHVQVLGTCDIYNTLDSTSNGYDIQIGVSGTNTLYHKIIGIKTSQADGGFHFIDTGSQAVVGCQFGKLFVNAGTTPVGANGGNYDSNRILGNVTVEISNSEFAANAFGAITITLAAGTSGHRFGASNGYDASCVITDNSVESTICDTRDMSNKTYTPTWTAASVNPLLGDGTLSGRYYRIGKLVFVGIKLVAGSTTTFGTGTWFFSLPFAPNTSFANVGSCKVLDSGTIIRTGVSIPLADGTARISAIIDSDTANVDSGRPMTWASGDELYISCCYLTN